MGASYPTAIRRFTTKHNVTDINFADDVNALQDEVSAIEQILGLSPAGTYTDVLSRLNGVDTSLANKAALNHTHTGTTTAPSVPLDGSVSMTGMLTLVNQNPTNNNHAARKKYVDDSINGLSFLTPFGQNGSSIAGSHGALGNLKLQGNSDVVTTNAAGGWSLNFPNTFPTGVMTAVACSGDSANPPICVSIIGNQVSNNGMGGDAYFAGGGSVGNSLLRVNWIALGW